MADKLAKRSIGDWSKSELANSLMHARENVKKAGKLGGIGPSAVGYSVNGLLRNAGDGLLGTPEGASTAQQIALGVVAVAAAGFRLGMTGIKETPASVCAAAAAEGTFFAMAERLIKTLGSPAKK